MQKELRFLQNFTRVLSLRVLLAFVSEPSKWEEGKRVSHRPPSAFSAGEAFSPVHLPLVCASSCCCPPAAHPQGAPSSCSIPGPAIARTQPMCQGRLLPGWLALPFSGEQVRALPCFSSGDRQSCVAFFLSVAVAHRTGGALLYSTSSPSDKLGRNFRVTTGCANVLMQ